MSLTPAVDGIAKGLGDSFSPMFIAFLRYFGAGFVALAFALATRQKVHIPRGDYLGQVFRTALIMGAMTALIAALALVPLANAVGGFLIAPIVSTALSVLLMGEKLTTGRAFGSVLSIAGAAIIMRPEGSLEIGTLLALLGGTLLGCYLAATRAATGSADALSTLILQCFLGSAMLAPFAFSGGIPTLTLQIPVGMLGLGVLSACCHFLTVAAYRRSEASLLSPFLYFNMIAAVLVGFLWFGETPTMLSLLGLAGIAGGGLVAISPATGLRQVWRATRLQLAVVRAGAARLGLVRLGLADDGSVGRGLVQRGSRHVGFAHFVLGQLGLARLGLMRLGLVALELLGHGLMRRRLNHFEMAHLG